jgi:hypothetical protein
MREDEDRGSDVVVVADVEGRRRKCEGRRRNMKTTCFLIIFLLFYLIN